MCKKEHASISVNPLELYKKKYGIVLTINIEDLNILQLLRI